MSERLQGKVAVVTGAARGIAGPVSPTLEMEPATPADMDETGREVAATGRRWLAIQLDQRDMGALRQAADLVRREFGWLDILFANAGIQAIKPLLEMEDADWADQIDTNLTASTQCRRGFKYGASYSASKWGLFGLVKSSALEWGEHNITINALVPGLIDTPMTRHEARYAQVIVDAGQQPTGDEDTDEAAAARIDPRHAARGAVDRSGGDRAGRGLPRVGRRPDGHRGLVRRHRRR